MYDLVSDVHTWSYSHLKHAISKFKNLWGENQRVRFMENLSKQTALTELLQLLCD